MPYRAAVNHATRHSSLWRELVTITLQGSIDFADVGKLITTLSSPSP